MNEARSTWASHALRITPHAPSTLQLGDVWRYRELLYFLVWRDIKVRYKQTVLGVLWALLQPIGMMAVFSNRAGAFS